MRLATIHTQQERTSLATQCILLKRSKASEKGVEEEDEEENESFQKSKNINALLHPVLELHEAE